MKKLASLLLALVMIMSCCTAMAATVTNATDHPYVAYQIFSATQAENGVALGDVVWGDGINSDAFLTALKGDDRFEVNGTNIFANCNSALSVAAALDEIADDSTIAKAFADVAAKHVITGAGTEIAANATTEDLSTGYYLVVDASGTITGNDALNAALLQVVKDGDFTIAKKYDVPEVDKKVDKVDANIGETVTFTLTATMPSTFEGYDAYKVVFHDTLSDGLAYTNNLKVTVNGTDKTTAFTTVAPSATSNTLTVSCNNVLATEVGATPGCKIVVTYTAVVDTDATIGGAGNKNDVYLEYSNNPNYNGEGTPTGNTPKDEVFVFTYELDVTKTDGEEADATKLPGAEFVLYRVNASSENEYAVLDANNKISQWTTTKANATTLTSGEDGLFKVIGLDQGTYFLEETKAPAGYNKLTDPIEFTITATYTKDEYNDDDIAIDTLNIKVGDKTTAGDKTTGIVGTTVINNAGSTLPETGGMGTTILYVGGGILVLAAIVLLIAKRRSTAE